MKEPPEETLRSEALASLLELVRLPGTSRHERAVADWLAPRFLALGFSTFEDDAARHTGGDCGNLVVEIPGKRPGRILLSAHLDVVPPGCCSTPRVEGGIVRGSGTILGGDARAGCAVLLAIASALAPRDPSLRPAIRIVLTVCEEVHLLGSRALAPETAAADLAYVLDSSTPVGTVITESPDALEVHAEFAGREAHAGLHPEDGVSAILVAARTIARLPTGRVDDETTANVGRIEGGTATNVVAGRASFLAEIRSFRPGGAESLARAWGAIADSEASAAGGRAILEARTAFRAYRHPPEAPVVRRFASACETHGVPLRIARTPGGSDANTLNERGTPSVVLGTGNRHPHSDREEIPVQDLGRLAALVLATVEGPG